ncbi:MAG: prepilin-type N-terminal cleavage/methylation domain-containing protein [Deltaproteobacteria bacterium]|nr:prepilin-type N-terminal cleavage/methylation domain-containing protein [Deltaproteobacteria bacterium]
MRSPRTAAFSLIELMIVVVVVGVLAAVAVVAYMRYVRKAKASEVPAIFAEFKTKEEAYHAEMGIYVSTGDYWPGLNGDRGTNIGGNPLPAAWQSLRIQPGKGHLYCQYRAVGGNAGTTPADQMGRDLFNNYPGSTPTRNWFYLMAECDFDNDMSVNSVYAQRGDMTGLVREDEGR